MNELLRTDMGIYVLREDTHLSCWIENANALGVGCHEIRQYAKHIPEGGVVIDAGACLGDHVAPFAHLVGPLGRVFAFEPMPATYEALCKNTAIYKNVSATRMALGREHRTAFMRENQNIGASAIDEGGDVQVRSTTLDAYFLPPLRRCDFIHLDAEGSEPDILRGARKLLEDFKPTLALEICARHLARQGESEESLRSLLKQLGYIVQELGSPYAPERNVLCIHPGRAAA